VSGGSNNTASGTSASIGGGEQHGDGFEVSTASGWGAGNPTSSGVPQYSAP
jgi:hypothetical protein